jgi:broad specificity phosphatase PhoE
MNASTHIYFIRHGETDENKAYSTGTSFKKAASGTNIFLNETGKQQADFLNLNIRPDIIFSSPLFRVKETAEIYYKNHITNNMEIMYDDRLTEYSKGKFDGIDFEEISRETRSNVKEQALLCTYDFSDFGGDSAEVIKKRVSSFLEEIKMKHHGKTIFCFTSGGIIRMIYHHFFNEQSPGMTKWLEIQNASVHHFIIYK